MFPQLLIFTPIALAIGYSAYLINWLSQKPTGTELQVEISKAIQVGSSAFLNREYRTVGIVAVVLAVILWVALGPIAALGFLTGAIASAVSGYIGMMIAVRSNAKTTKAAGDGLASALSLAFKAGAVTGFFVVALGLLAVSVFYYWGVWLQDFGSLRNGLVGLGFGASLISVFARLGGGIFTKAADVGADLVGKVEAGIPEDDLRNPAVIADLVGDNVGDCAGMAADLFETYAVTLAAAIILSALISTIAAGVIPLILGGAAMLASILGSLLVSLPKSGSIMGALYRGLTATLVISALLFYLAILQFAAFLPHGITALEAYVSTLVGLAVTVLMVLTTDYYTSKKYRPVQSIATASKSGHGTNIILGLSVGMEGTTFPIVIIAAAILGSFSIAGLYGVALAAVAMLSQAGIIIAIDSFGPITDNAGGIAEMSDAPKGVRKITDALDAVGNTTKAVTKGYAIASAGLAALVLFADYVEELTMGAEAATANFSIQNPLVLVGLLLGAALPYLFGSMAMKSVGRTAGAVVEEVRRQFREIPGLWESIQKDREGIMSRRPQSDNLEIEGVGIPTSYSLPTLTEASEVGAGGASGERTAKPDYKRAVDIVTKAALSEMIVPTLLPIAVVLIVGLVFKEFALGGLLIGTIISGLFVALSMTTGGAAWDNAKKYIEEGHFGGKSSETHKAAVTGDTVGDPYKDTAGPAINPLIKLINIVALLLVPFL